MFSFHVADDGTMIELAINVVIRYLHLRLVEVGSYKPTARLYQFVVHSSVYPNGTVYTINTVYTMVLLTPWYCLHHGTVYPMLRGPLIKEVHIIHTSD